MRFSKFAPPYAYAHDLARRRKKRRLRDEYDVGDEIGRGAYSVVKRVTHKESGVLYACKILDNYSNMENGASPYALVLCRV